jgi:hypothetical protein
MSNRPGGRELQQSTLQPETPARGRPGPEFVRYWRSGDSCGEFRVPASTVLTTGRGVPAAMIMTVTASGRPRGVTASRRSDHPTGRRASQPGSDGATVTVTVRHSSLSASEAQLGPWQLRACSSKPESQRMPAMTQSMMMDSAPRLTPTGIRCRISR